MMWSMGMFRKSQTLEQRLSTIEPTVITRKVHVCRYDWDLIFGDWESPGEHIDFGVHRFWLDKFASEGSIRLMTLNGLLWHVEYEYEGQWDWLFDLPEEVKKDLVGYVENRFNEQNPLLKREFEAVEKLKGFGVLGASWT